tara:strand:- start:361 stop:603 length:243 start_codon:yes stop_codon:yes gene_type:complete
MSEDKWEGEYRGIVYEVSAESNIESPFLKVFFYEDDNPSNDMIHHGYCNTLTEAHKVAKQIIDEVLGEVDTRKNPFTRGD